jgi:hypothetical protein
LELEAKDREYTLLKNEELKLEPGIKLTKACLAEREALNTQQYVLNKDLNSIIENKERVMQEIQALERHQEEFEASERNKDNAELITTPPTHWTISSIQWIKTLACKVDVTGELRTKVEHLFEVSRNFYPEVRKSGSYKILSVSRLENPNLWKLYSLQRHCISEEIAFSQFDKTKLNYGSRTDWSETFLDNRSNEVFLFHGTKPECVDSIVNMGFDERVFNPTGLFGAGIYFADSVDKSYKYCKDVPGSTGSCFIFIARVVLGLPCEAEAPRNMARRPPHLKGNPCQFYNSVIGVTTKTHPQAHLTKYREYIVYDRHQTYPELLVEFTRV